MTYSIGQVAKRLGLTTHTLRYYDKEGLLPSVHKSSSGLRVFTEKDLEWLIIVECLKGCGMHLKDIKHYIDMCMQGDSTIAERLAMFKKQKEHLALQMEQLQAHMEKIDYTLKRNLDRNQLERLAFWNFVKEGQNLFITGSSGT